MVYEPKGCDFNKQSSSGRTGFIWACLYNHIDIVKTIAENSSRLAIDLNIQDSDGNSGLMDACASSYRQDKVVDFLLANSEKYNINLDLRNKKNKNAKDLWPGKFSKSG